MDQILVHITKHPILKQDPEITEAPLPLLCSYLAPAEMPEVNGPQVHSDIELRVCFKMVSDIEINLVALFYIWRKKIKSTL